MNGPGVLLIGGNRRSVVREGEILHVGGAGGFLIHGVNAAGFRDQKLVQLLGALVNVEQFKRASFAVGVERLERDVGCGLVKTGQNGFGTGLDVVIVFRDPAQEGIAIGSLCGGQGRADNGVDGHRGDGCDAGGNREGQGVVHAGLAGVAVHEGVAADGAGVGRVAQLGGGGRRHNVGVGAVDGLSRAADGADVRVRAVVVGSPGAVGVIAGGGDHGIIGDDLHGCSGVGEVLAAAGAVPVFRVAVRAAGRSQSSDVGQRVAMLAAGRRGGIGHGLSAALQVKLDRLLTGIGAGFVIAEAAAGIVAQDRAALGGDVRVASGKVDDVRVDGGLAGEQGIRGVGGCADVVAGCALNGSRVRIDRESGGVRGCSGGDLVVADGHGNKVSARVKNVQPAVERDSAGRVDDQVLAEDQILRGINENVIAALAGTGFGFRVDGVQGRVRRRDEARAKRVVFRLSRGLCNRGVRPAAEGPSVHDSCSRGQGHGVARVDGRGGIDAAVCHVGQGDLLSGCKVDLNGAVGGRIDREDVAVLGHGGSAGGHGEARGIVAVGGGGGDGGPGDGDRAPRVVVRGRGHGVGGRSGAAGGGGVVRGNGLAKELEGQLGIVHEDVADAGDVLHNVVAAHLPGVHGILTHPIEQDVLALDDAGGAPHVVPDVVARGAVFRVDEQQDPGAVAAHVDSGGNRVRVKVAGALAVGRVAAAGVLADGGRTEHHDILGIVGVGFRVGVSILGMGPDVLAVPGGAAVPGAGDLRRGVEGGDIADVAVDAVGVAVHGTGRLVARVRRVLCGQHILQSRVERAARGVALRRAARFGRQGFVGIAAGVVVLGVGGEEGAVLTSGTPVLEIGAAGVIDDVRGLGIARRRTGQVGCGRSHGQPCEQGDDQGHRQQEGERPSGYGVLHNESSIFQISVMLGCSNFTRNQPENQCGSPHYFEKCHQNSPMPSGRSEIRAEDAEIPARLEPNRAGIGAERALTRGGPGASGEANTRIFRRPEALRAGRAESRQRRPRWNAA